MTIRDFLDISIGNLWRMKLRAFLTISGVVIAIAAFVSMVSFGAGNQQNIYDRFEQFGLFSTMQVFPKDEDDSTYVTLDESMLNELANVPGVRLAYPYRAYEVSVTLLDTTLTTETQALPLAALQTPLFSQLKAGRSIASDTAREALVMEEFLKEHELGDPDSVIGRSIRIAKPVAMVDSAFARLLDSEDWSFREAIRGIRFDSLRDSSYRNRIMLTEVNQALARLVDGFLNAQGEAAETLTVVGVLKGEMGRRARVSPVIVPLRTGQRFEHAGAGGSPLDIMTAVTRGGLLATGEDLDRPDYSMVTLNIDAATPYEEIKDSVEALGFGTFSYAEAFEEIRKFFMYFNLALGGIGLIALLTASLGIVNALVMSIIERRREIGTLKALGADERDIRLLFLAESGVIGLVGAIGGIAFGWLITRLASIIARSIMENEGVDPMELFALPWWLILIALSIGVVVSMLAGLYPAARAARIDPVQALRGE